MRTLAWIYASIIGCVVVYLVFVMARDIWGIGTFGAALIAAVACIPVLGNAAGAYAAMKVWGWSFELAFSVFFLSVAAVSVIATKLDGRKREVDD